jgi:putative Mg2+ transporter-C (MgtC) family protein
METFEPFDKLLRLELDFAIKFLVAVICGGAIGMEREFSGKPAGIRTSIMVCVGAMLFTVMSFEMAGRFGGDQTRIAAQIVTGVGFLGAGAILHESGRGITGMTTAAMIWLIAALGMMIGSGYLISAVAISAASVVLILMLKRIEKRIDTHRGKHYTIVVPDQTNTRGRVETLMMIHEKSVRSVEVQNEQEETFISFQFTGSESERYDLLNGLSKVEGLRLRGDSSFHF